MSTIIVHYAPPPASPPPPPGRVTVTMDAELAIKLKALLGHCNGGHFDRLHSALKESLVDARSLNDFRLVYRCGADEEVPPTKRQYIDLMHRYEFLPA